MTATKLLDFHEIRYRSFNEKSSEVDFRENWVSKSSILLKGVNEILPVPSAIALPFGYILAQEVSTDMCGVILSS